MDSFVSTGQGFVGYNMFAYCGNSPISYYDRCGTVSEHVSIDDDPHDNLWPDPDGGMCGGPTGYDPYQSILDGQNPGPFGSTSPNPYGRHGGPSHSGLVDSLRLLFDALGFDVSPKERRVPIPGSGKYRYPDLIVDTGDEIIYVQVGKSTLDGNPIAREKRAIDDLSKTGNNVCFFAYDD